MGKTIIYEKLQDVVFGAFGKDSSGVSPEEVMARINDLAAVDSTNADDINNGNPDNTDTSVTTDTIDTNDNVTNNDNNANVDNNDNVDDVVNVVDDNNVDNDDTTVDDIINVDKSDDNVVNNDITLSELFKAHFNIEEFDEGKILDKVKRLEEEKSALILEKEKLQRDSFIKEKGITKEVFEALSGNTLKEKDQALKKVVNLSGFKLNSSNEVKTKEIKFNSAF